MFCGMWYKNIWQMQATQGSVAEPVLIRDSLLATPMGLRWAIKLSRFLLQLSNAFTPFHLRCQSPASFSHWYLLQILKTQEGLIWVPTISCCHFPVIGWSLMSTLYNSCNMNPLISSVIQVFPFGLKGQMAKWNTRFWKSWGGVFLLVSNVCVFKVLIETYCSRIN